MLKSKNIPTLTGAAAAALTSLAMTQAALAAGPVPVATPEPVIIGPAGNWYAGIEAGMSSGAKYSSTETIPNDSYCSEYIYNYEGATGADCGRSERGTGDADGTALGLFIGYNTMRGDMLVGGELRAMSFSDGDTVELVPGAPGLMTFKVGLGEIYELRARVGTQVSDKAMVYGALGMARGSLDATACFLGICGTTSYNDTAPTAGLGLEYDLSDKTFVGADYTMRQFEFSGEDVDVNTLTVRLGYRF